MSLHKEVQFENDICAHLAAHGWLYAEGDAAAYDRARALFPADVLSWVQTTQPKAWETLTKNHGASAAAVLLDRVRKQLDDRGTLDVLRHGVELVGLRQSLALAQFKPALAMNPELQARYEANRLRVVRQVRYSLHNENAIDLVLFVNGLPVATAELKSQFTQRVDDAVDQYRFDRHPRPKGQAPEPLLDLPRGALVHFAVSNEAVRIVVKIGVAYGSPVREVTELLLDVAARHGLVEDDPLPQVQFEDFGSDALLFVQPFLASRYSPVLVERAARAAELVQRPEVRRAIETYGRIVEVPLYRISW